MKFEFLTISQLIYNRDMELDGTYLEGRHELCELAYARVFHYEKRNAIFVII